MWSILKNITNHIKEIYINRRFILSDESIRNDRKLISNKFNDFFINVGPNLANRFERQNKSSEQFMKANVLIACTWNLLQSKKYINRCHLKNRLRDMTT